jgi:hypothetical protein
LGAACHDLLSGLFASSIIGLSLVESSGEVQMRKTLMLIFLFVMAFPTLWAAAQTATQKSKKNSSPAPVAHPVKAPEAPKRLYADLSIGELVSEDPNRWTDKMSSHAALSGFVTDVAKRDDGDVTIRICETPRIEGMDRARCIVAQCIPKIPCDAPKVGKPITVDGITRYDARVGSHWWEINPVEQIEK